jgi:eukaryotic-like serine/threonine-protein kinase
LTPVTQLVRRYDIGGLIAEGGMAEIVAACAVSEAGVSKRVALKRIRSESASDPAFVSRFFDEVRLVMQLSHANVVQVFDFGRTETRDFFLAMEFVEGVDVQRLRRSPGCERLPPAEALHIVAGALRGLDYAHRRADPDNRPLGIVHLDVKPANVLLSFEGEVKLTDFGVARSRDANRPIVGISGTIPFMSPEQARGDRVDPRSDVFSAGVLLYALLSGECPFGEEDTERTLEQVRLCHYKPPVQVDGFQCFDALLRRALDPEPDRRFVSAGAFADAIEELMFTQGWRGGSAALGERVRNAFPRERERLNALFEPGRRREGLEVARPASARGGEGTLLSRVALAEPPRRQTVAAMILPARATSRRTAWATATVALVAVAAGAGGVVVMRGRAADPPVTVAAAAPPTPAQPIAAPPSTRPQPIAAPSPPDPAHEVVAVTPTSVPPTPTPRGQPPAPRPAPTGTLSVNASPWGTVYVNGRLAGTTPLLRFPVRAGRAQVAIENPKLGRKVVDVRIEPRQDTPLIVDLRPPPETK